MPRFTGLWRHREFRRLWAGQTISLVGSQVTLLALPLTAVLSLKASPVQMGVLGAVQFAPFLLVGLFAGVWVDRLRRRPILMAADFGRAVLLSSIPAAALLHRLGMPQLYIVGFLVGVLTVFFDVAYQSFLPALVNREALVEGNSKLETSESLARIGGPGIAGALVQAITAPISILVDAASFLVSVFFLRLIRTPEPPALTASERRTVWSEIGEGVRVVVGNPLLRGVAGCTATSNFFGNIGQAVYVLYVVRRLGIAPGVLGLIYAVGSVGGLAGAIVVSRVAERLGVGRAIWSAILLGSVAGLLVPLAARPLAFALPLLIVAQSLTGFGSTIYNINQVSLRQTITPDRLLGRMNASMRFIVWGTIPLGSLIGGFLGQGIGLRPTLLIGALGSLLSVLWVLFSPVRSLRSQPEPAFAGDRG
jgi:MFS family permease